MDLVYFLNVKYVFLDFIYVEKRHKFLKILFISETSNFLNENTM